MNLANYRGFCLVLVMAIACTGCEPKGIKKDDARALHNWQTSHDAVPSSLNKGSTT